MMHSMVWIHGSPCSLPPAASPSDGVTLQRCGWIDAYTAQGSASKSLLWMLARLAATALFFVFAVHFGAWPLVAAFLGFLAARQIAVRAARRAA